MKTFIITNQGPYRYVDCGHTEFGTPDYRLQEKDPYSNKYKDIYLFDNRDQMLLAIEDYDYTLWLANEPCYIKDVVTNHYN